MTQLFKCTNATFAESYYQEHELSELIVFLDVTHFGKFQFRCCTEYWIRQRLHHRGSEEKLLSETIWTMSIDKILFLIWGSET